MADIQLSTLLGITQGPIVTPIRNITSNTTLEISDSSAYITATSSTGLTVSIPTNASVEFPIGVSITIEQSGTGQVTISGESGVIIHTADGNKTNGQYTVVMIHKKDTDTWTLIGGVS
jgi:hypothetical protein